MHLPPLSRWAIWPLICVAMLTLSVIRGDMRELYGGDWRALYDGSIAQRYERDIVEPDYVLTGPRRPLPVDTRLASLDSLGGPRILPPPLCGRYAVPGVWRAEPRNTFSGRIWDGRLHPTNCACTGGPCLACVGAMECPDRSGTASCDQGVYQCAQAHGATPCTEHDLGPAERLSIARINPGWQALLGQNGYTGHTRVDERGILTVAAPASEDWQIGDGGLLCIDTDLESDGDSGHALSGSATIQYTDGTGIVYVDGQLTVGAGAEITVEQAPPYYPITLLEARGGLSGSFTAGSLPAGWVLLQDTHFVRLDYQP